MKNFSYSYFILILALILNASLATAAGKLLPVPLGAKPIPDQYIVVLHNAAPARAMNQTAFVKAESTRIASYTGATVMSAYGHALTGFAVKANSAQLKMMLQDPAVNYIEQDQLVSAQIRSSQSPAPWGLNRIDQRHLPLDNQYKYDWQSGEDHTVEVYVLDSGIYPHPEFNGRLQANGFTTIHDGRGTGDCSGHGTAVAGIIGSGTYGVVKFPHSFDIRLFSVRVLDCNNNGSVSGIINGINWIISNAGPTSVANMSLGALNSTALDNAAAAAVQSGIFVVAAAGNFGANTCVISPARVSSIMTVSVTDSNDQRPAFANFGGCNNIFAPGVDIPTTSMNGSSTLVTGTSFAAPHVSGVAAIYLMKNGPTPPATVFQNIIDTSTKGVVGNTAGSPNRLLYSHPTSFIIVWPPF